MRMGAILFIGAMFMMGDAHAQAPLTPAIPHTGGRTVQEMQIIDGVPHALNLTSQRHQWPGVYFETRFSGRELALDFNDTYNRYRLYIDDRAPIIIDRPANTPYIVKNLPQSWHTARLEKLSESQSETGSFYGFSATDGELAPFPARSRQIEFIGDSYTAGYGNTSSKRECTKDEIRATTDTQAAFGPLTAKHFDADYQINAYSGIGIVRNYDGVDPKRNMPLLYRSALMEDETLHPYADPQWNPAIIIIALGGNDFSTPLHAGEKWTSEDALTNDYIASYVSFIKQVRTDHPKAQFILLDYGEGRVVSATVEVIKRLLADGETHIVPFSAGNDFKLTGCDWHLNTADDKRISDKLIAYLEAHPDLWQDKP